MSRIIVNIHRFKTAYANVHDYTNVNAEALVNASWIVHTDRSSSNKRNTSLAQDVQTFSKYCMTEMKCLYSGNS